MLITVDNTTNHNYNSTLIDKSPLLNSDEDSIITTPIADSNADSNAASITTNQIYTNDCPICFEITTDNIIFDCKHSICLQCLQSIYWTHGIKHTIVCPLCRNEIEAAHKHDTTCTNQSSTHPTHPTHPTYPTQSTHPTHPTYPTYPTQSTQSSELTTQSQYTIQSTMFWTFYMICIVIICVIGIIMIQSQYNVYSSNLLGIVI
jgi:hypothetical protein